jgi:biopolymer transport protein ExbD
MILDREKRKKRRAQTDEAIHIVALWNLMLILIPFLLLSAAFSETSILNLMIPSTAAATPPNKKEIAPPKESIQLILKLNGFALIQGVSRNRMIPLKSGLYDYPALLSALEQFKKVNSGEETIVLSGSSKVSYETIVQAMDQCREAGFPNILLGADSPGENL